MSITSGGPAGFPLSAEAASAPSSGIAAVMRHGFANPDVIRLWVGEGDLPTASEIREAAKASLDRGETFYMPEPGIPELRAELARYHDRLYGGLFGAPFSAERFFVTGSGMQAIQMAIRLVTGAGDEVIVPTPAWPNFAAALGVASARACEVPMQFGRNGWTLDIDRIAAAIGPRTRAISLNSPSNPTGWTASIEDLARLLALARRHGLWIIADEVYGRFDPAPGALVAPSLHALIEPDDRVIFVNTFSKNWSMTGWRIGWIEAPAVLAPAISNLIQYSTSGVPVFVQRAAIRALELGDAAIAPMIGRGREGREIVTAALSGDARIRFAPPGAIYLFLAIDGMTDSTETASRLIREAGVGLAPGSAFGSAGEGFLRLCFARDPAQVRVACARLVEWLQAWPR